MVTVVGEQTNRQRGQDETATRRHTSRRDSDVHNQHHAIHEDSQEVPNRSPGRLRSAVDSEHSSRRFRLDRDYGSVLALDE